MAESVASWTFEKRLENTFTRTLPKLGPEAREQLAAIINPTSLAIVAGVLVAWVVSHLIGIGEIVDIIILVVGVFAIGFAVFTGLDHLYSFAKGAYYATSENDLEVASKHLAEAITILGIQAVLAVLFRGKPNVKKGGPINVGPRRPEPQACATNRLPPQIVACEAVRVLRVFGAIFIFLLEEVQTIKLWCCCMRKSISFSFRSCTFCAASALNSGLDHTFDLRYTAILRRLWPRPSRKLASTVLDTSSSALSFPLTMDTFFSQKEAGLIPP
jgi:hypothetical protein